MSTIDHMPKWYAIALTQFKWDTRPGQPLGKSYFFLETKNMRGVFGFGMLESQARVIFGGK